MRYLLLLTVIAASLTSCNLKPSKDYIGFGGFTQGTTYSITYESPDSINYKKEIDYLLAKIDTSLSTYNPYSVISKINRNESNKTDKYIRTVFRKADEVYNATNGNFDITVAPLVNAWGFGFKKKEEMTNAKVDSILEFVGFNLIRIKDSVIIKQDGRVTIDMNAIAQGYSVDLVAQFLEEQGVENYLVEIGGEVKAKGVNRKFKAWKIGIDKPFDNNNVPGENLQAIIKLSNKSLATAGNYRKFYIRDGIKHSHTINPKTGYSVNHSLLSVTVIGNDCITSDAYATAFLVMGLEKAYDLVMKTPDLEAYFVYSDEKGNYKVKMTPTMQALIEDIK